MADQFITTTKMAARWGRTRLEIERWRSEKRSLPPHFKSAPSPAGRYKIIYRLADVVAFEKANTWVFRKKIKRVDVYVPEGRYKDLNAIAHGLRKDPLTGAERMRAFRDRRRALGLLELNPAMPQFLEDEFRALVRDLEGIA